MLTVPSLCIVEVRVTVSNIECCATMLLWRNYAAGNNKTHLGLHANCPVFLSDFNRICIFSPHFDRSPQYQITRKSLQWDPRRYMWTHGRMDMTKLIGALRDYANAPKEILKKIKAKCAFWGGDASWKFPERRLRCKPKENSPRMLFSGIKEQDCK
jgi:hypothetical protein